jgi:hypothetical protein
MPVSVLAAGVSSASLNPTGFGSSSGFGSNSLDTSVSFQSSFGANRSSSPNLTRKPAAPSNPSSNSYAQREPPLPPTRPSPVPNSFGGSSSILPPPIMPQPASTNRPQTNSSSSTNNLFSELNEKLARQVARAQTSSSLTPSQSSSNMFHGLDPFATPVSQYQNGTSNPPIPARPTPSIPPRPNERPPVPQRN